MSHLHEGSQVQSFRHFGFLNPLTRGNNALHFLISPHIGSSFDRYSQKRVLFEHYNAGRILDQEGLTI